MVFQPKKGKIIQDLISNYNDIINEIIVKIEISKKKKKHIKYLKYIIFMIFFSNYIIYV
jgi:hypothetical protein